MQRLTTTHVRRWHRHRHTVGRGHLYQGAYKSFPVPDDEPFYTVCRYVERNASRAQLAPRAEQWRWESQAQRLVFSVLPSFAVAGQTAARVFGRLAEPAHDLPLLPGRFGNTAG